jgi:hypothetical protein
LKKFIVIFLIFNLGYAEAQVKDTLVRKPGKDTMPYNRKEEILYNGMRFRKYNSYLTFGGSFAYSNVRSYLQKGINVDFQFHLQRQYFQVGFLMSGNEFLSNNNIQGHVCYGLRRERNKTNFAVFLGPSYSYFVTGKNDSTGKNTIAVINNVLGGYLCLQGIYKFKYDVGIGLELFADISPLQTMLGGRLVIYFSGAYRGIKRGVKPKKS